MSNGDLVFCLHTLNPIPSSTSTMSSQVHGQECQLVRAESLDFYMEFGFSYIGIMEKKMETTIQGYVGLYRGT